MKQVLIIAPDFVPSSLPPATRVRFFANHLAEFGWKPIILSTKPEFYHWPIDAENEQLLDEDLEIIRANAWRSSWTSKIGFGDVGMRSLWSHWSILKRICRERQIDLIFIPVPPYVPMVLGRMAYQKFRIPYVIDYIDPWVTEYYWKLPRAQRPPKWPLAYAMSRLLEPYAIRKVAHITGVSKGTTDSVVDRYRRLSEGDASEIPYGAEPEDFEYVRRHPRRHTIFDRHDGLVHITYIGACIPGMYPAVKAVFEAVKLGLKHAPEQFRRLRLHFVGTSYAPEGNSIEGVASLARDAGIGEQVNEHPRRVSYLDSLQIMLDSDMLLLVGSDEAHYTASKVFPYLLSARPLLAVFHEESSINQILRQAGADAAITFNAEQPPHNRIEEIMSKLDVVLEDGIAMKEVGGLVLLELYTTRAMTKLLAGGV